MKIQGHATSSATIAEVEAKAQAALLLDALRDAAKYIWRGDWDKLKPETRAMIGEKE